MASQKLPIAHTLEKNKKIKNKTEKKPVIRKATHGKRNSKMKGMTPREVYDKFIEEECPMKKEQTVEDVAKAVAFFASEDANVITGQSLNVNGGTRMD